MAELLTQLKSDMKDAMRARAKDRLTTIRMLISAVNNKQIDSKDELTDDDILAILNSEAKKRRDASEQFRAGNRPDLADKEDVELVLIQSYLPAQLTDDEAAAIVDEIIAATGAVTKADMGKVMGQTMPKIKGRYDGKKIKDLVMSKLA